MEIAFFSNILGLYINYSNTPNYPINLPQTGYLVIADIFPYTWMNDYWYSINNAIGFEIKNRTEAEHKS